MKLYSSLINKYYNDKILMGRLQVEVIAMTVCAQSPLCNMLVFGAGNDSILRHELVKEFGGGTVVFLETSQEWIDRMKASNPELDIRKYDLKGATVEASLKAVPEWREPPAAMLERKWDIILIDGPGGFSPKAPGRAYPIMWASRLRSSSTYVFVDDYNRELERIYADKFLGTMNTVHDPAHQIDKKAVLAYNLGEPWALSACAEPGRASVYNYWRDQMLALAGPILSGGANDQLKMALSARAANKSQKTYIHLEAVSRTICGIAPWLEFLADGADDSESANFRQYVPLAQKCIANIVNPDAEDFVNVNGEFTQPLCEAAFLAQGILRAKHALWDLQDDATKLNIIEFFKKTRKIRPVRHNWILFSAMVETFLHEIGADASYAAIDYALSQFDQWYVGDGWYKDGCRFAFDYYNSFVIHPMLLDISRRMPWISKEKYADFIARAKRYGEILYRLIAPDGTFPLLGRSITYRLGAFHLLAQLLYSNLAPDGLSCGAMRAALTSVLRRIMAGQPLDKDGFLKVGVIGEQRGLAEPYISCGSAYLCMTFFGPLGLSPLHPFWTEPDEAWISCALWSGKNLKADHAF